MSTPFRRYTGPKCWGRWGRRLFGGMGFVYIVIDFGVDGADFETTYVYPF